MPIFKSNQPTELDTLKGLILFARDLGIPHFKYKDFEFNLSRPNPNETHLEALTQDLAKLRSIVNGLQLKEEFKPNNVFNRAEALAMHMGRQK